MPVSAARARCITTTEGEQMKLKPIMVLYTDGTFEEMLNRTVLKRYPGIEFDTDEDGCGRW